MKQPLFTSNFKMYFKRVLAFSLSLLALYSAASCTALALDCHFDTRNGTQKVTACQLADFYAMPENSLDLLILGSSHAMCSYDPAKIKAEFGLNTFNLGTALQQPDTAYYLFKEVLKTQKPKYLIYDVYFKVFLEEYSNEQAITVLKEMPLSRNSFALFWNNLNMDGKSSYYSNWLNPFATIQSVTENPAPIENSPPEAYLGNGFYSSEETVTGDLLLPENHPFSNDYSGFNARQVKYLKKLITLAQENGVQVILTSAPLPPTILSRVEYYDEVKNDTAKIAEEFSIPYFDFTLPSREFLTDCDFADQGHLNRVGVSKFMDYFIKKIKANEVFR